MEFYKNATDAKAPPLLFCQPCYQPVENVKKSQEPCRYQPKRNNAENGCGLYNEE